MQRHPSKKEAAAREQQDEELKKKIALYYHSLVLSIIVRSFFVVLRLSESMVRVTSAEQLLQADQAPVHRPQYPHSKELDSRLRFGIG